LSVKVKNPKLGLTVTDQNRVECKEEEEAEGYLLHSPVKHGTTLGFGISYFNKEFPNQSSSSIDLCHYFLVRNKERNRLGLWGYTDGFCLVKVRFVRIICNFRQ
jgi:hypothetical protein